MRSNLSDLVILTGKIFLSYLHDFRLFWSSGLSFKARNASTREHQEHHTRFHWTESWGCHLATLASGTWESIGKESNYAGYSGWSRLSVKNRCYNNGGKGDYVWNTGDSLGYVFIFPCPLIKVNEKLKLNSVSISNS